MHEQLRVDWGLDKNPRAIAHKGRSRKARTVVGTRLFRLFAASGLLGSLVATAPACLELTDSASLELRPSNTGGESGSGVGGEGGSAGAGGSGGSTEVAMDPAPVDKQVDMVCANDFQCCSSVLPWRLTVDPSPIERGGKFSVTFGGVAIFDKRFLELGNQIVVGGIKEVNLVELKATVVAHAGATGPPVVLRPASPPPYQCQFEDPVGSGTRSECDPANDLPGFGPVGNTDCEPVDESNPCGRFLALPISEDCEPRGVCWNLGREDTPGLCPLDDFCEEAAKNQCDLNGFCLTGDLEIPLGQAVGEFVADSGDEVVFGWHEPDRWLVPGPPFPQDPGPSSLRIYVTPQGFVPIPVGFECLLGSDTDFGQGPLPDEALISFGSIPERACFDGTRVCPPGFGSADGGVCVFSSKGEPFYTEDPSFDESPSVTSCSGPVDFSLGGDRQVPSEALADSESLMVEATVKVKNADDETCVASTEPTATVSYRDERGRERAFDWVTFNTPTELSVEHSASWLRRTTMWLWSPPVVWSANPDVCCERTFQTTWRATVPQCEDW